MIKMSFLENGKCKNRKEKIGLVKEAGQKTPGGLSKVKTVTFLFLYLH